MALVHNGFSTYRLFAASQTVARLNVALTKAVKRFSESRRLTSINDLRSGLSPQSDSGPLPGSRIPLGQVTKGRSRRRKDRSSRCRY